MNEFDDLIVMIRVVRAILIGAALGIIVGTLVASAAYSDDRLAIYMEVEKQARAYQMDPDLVLAVIQVESAFNPYKRGEHGEVGLMQLLPIYFPDAKYDITSNIQTGVAHLSFARANCPIRANLMWTICYNNGTSRHPKYPKQHPYYKRVMRAYEQIKKEEVASRK